MTEFVGVIAADKLVGNALREVGPVSEEKDALHQIIAIEAIGEWLSGPAQREWLDRRVAAYGPSDMAPRETRVAEAAPITAAQLAELRAVAEALAADNSAPLPDGDAGLVEAAWRHRESRRRCHALYDQFNINPEAGKTRRRSAGFSFPCAAVGIKTGRIGPIPFQASFGSKRFEGVIRNTDFLGAPRSVSLNRLPRRPAAWAGAARSRFRSGLGDMQADLV